MKVAAGSALLLFTLVFSAAAQTPPGRGTTVSPNLFGSVSQGAPGPAPASLSIADAIDRALRYNLGPVLAGQDVRVVSAARTRALSELLPKVYTTLNETVEQLNLAAFGFTSFPGVPQVIGPFSVFDVRAHYTQTAVDMRYLHELKAATDRVTAGNFAQQDTRELVVLITTDLYLEAVAGASRVQAAQAQLKTAQAVYNRAVVLKDTGVIPGIDVLRAQVQLQAQQQRVISEENDLAKAKLNLARAVGLPQGQTFNQTDSFVTTLADVPKLEDALAAALESRPDYLRASALVRAAEQSRKAAESRRLPSLLVNADYGDTGPRPGTSHGTVTLGGTLLVPIYTGERTRAEIVEADALLEQRRAEASNLRDRIEYDVRTAELDIRSAAEQVRVAQSARDLAQQQLVQAQDRFAAGVTNGLEVTQAQDAVATSDENYISSLFSLNVAEASLARALGSAEKTVKSFFGGK
jgi:outer membrane protein TolC